MKGHGTKFERKKEEAIVALLSHRTLEEAARAVGIAPNTLLRWQQAPEFRESLRKARRDAYGNCIARLQQASGVAVSVLLKVLADPATPSSVRVRAVDSVLSHAAKAIEIEDIDARVTALEQAAAVSKGR